MAGHGRSTGDLPGLLPADDGKHGAWVTRLIDHFAGYYFRALDAYDRGSDLSQCWQRAFDETRQPGTTVIQQLLMGVSAHISCDLVLVLDDLLRPVWAQLSAAERERRHADYRLVNTIIGETIDTVQDEVIVPYAQLMGLIDQLAGPFDEWLTARLLSNWRDDVWQRTMGLLAENNDERRAALRRDADQTALRRIVWLDGSVPGAALFAAPLAELQRRRLL